MVTVSEHFVRISSNVLLRAFRFDWLLRCPDSDWDCVCGVSGSRCDNPRQKWVGWILVVIALFILPFLSEPRGVGRQRVSLRLYLVTESRSPPDSTRITLLNGHGVKLAAGITDEKGEVLLSLVSDVYDSDHGSAELFPVQFMWIIVGSGERKHRIRMAEVVGRNAIRFERMPISVTVRLEDEYLFKVNRENG